MERRSYQAKHLLNAGKIEETRGKISSSFEASDHFCRISSILQSTRIISYLKILIKRMCLILKTISREKAKLSLIEIQ